MSNAFSLFGLTPTFRKFVRFLNQEHYVFTDAAGKDAVYSSLDFFLFLVSQDPEPSLFNYANLDRSSFCKAYLTSFRFTWQNGEPRMKIGAADAPGRGQEIKDGLFSIADEMFAKYYLPLIFAEGNQLNKPNISLDKDESGTWVPNIEKASDLEKIRFALTLLSGETNSTSGSLDPSEIRTRAKRYLEYLSLYAVDAVIERQLGEEVSVNVHINIRSEDNSDVKDVQKIVREFLDGPLIGTVAFIIDSRITFTSQTGEKTQQKEKRQQKKAVPPPSKGNTIRVSGHFIDQTLKDHKTQQNKQLSLQLKPEVIKKISRETEQTYEQAMEWINQKGEGISLSGSEYKLIDCIREILQEKSQTSDPTSDDYFAGNAERDMVRYGKQEVRAPSLTVTLYEVAKKYRGNMTPTGPDVDTVERLLDELSDQVDKRVLIRHKVVTKKGKMTEIQEIVEFHPLLRKSERSSTLLEDDVPILQKRWVTISLNPIFRHSIEKKYLRSPTTSQMVSAAQSQKISDVTYKLRDYLLRELSNSRLNPEIGVNNLFHTIASDYMKKSRISLVKKYFSQAVDTLKRLRIIEEVNQVPAQSGDEKFVFRLNKNWPELLEG